MTNPCLSVRAGGLRTVGAACAALLLTLPASAQSYDVLVSTSSDGAIAGDPVRDEDLLWHGPGAPARIAYPGETLAALAGDVDGDGYHTMFGDVDALHDAGGATGGVGLHLSLVSDEAGFQDGDVLLWVTGGFEVVVSETELLAVVGATDGNLDVDAIHIEADGQLLFSLAENEDSSLLSGDDAGIVADGDVLAWTPGGGPAVVVLTEQAIDGLVSQAVGAPTSSGDTKGLARDPATGALLFTVQSPSEHDASVFTEAGGGGLVGGHLETDFGFDTATELDALTIASASWTSLTVSDPLPGAGDAIVFTLRGAEPDTPHVLLLAASLSDPWLDLTGWGGLVLANDAAFAVGLSALPFLTVTADASGNGTLTVPVPLASPAIDLMFQVVGLGMPRGGTNPVVLELLQ